jgi:hypothetical protein
MGVAAVAAVDGERGLIRFQERSEDAKLVYANNARLAQSMHTPGATCRPPNAHNARLLNAAPWAMNG